MYKAALLVLFLFSALACTQAQEGPVPMPDAIDQLEQRFAVSISYDAALLEPLMASAIPQGNTLESCLQELLKEQELEYLIINQTDIIIRPFEPQLVRLCGYVKDADSRMPLPYANVQLGQSSAGCATNDKGYFELEASLSKQAELQFSYLGYQSIEEDAWKYKAGSCPTLLLKSIQTELSAITIKEFTTEMLEASTPNGFRFKPEKIPTLPGWGEPDLLRSLQLLPGISAADESATNLNIRGGSSDQNLVLWDDIPIYHTGHFFGFYSSVNPYIAQSVDIHRSGFGVEYGGRVSGVIDIKGKPSFNPEGDYGIGWNLINLHGYAEIPIKKGHSALLIAARRSYTDLIQSATYRNIFRQVFSKGRVYDTQGLVSGAEEEVQAVPNFYYSDFNLKWAAQPSDQLDMSISIYQAQDAFRYEFNADSLLSTRDSLNISNTGISARLKYEWSKGTATEFLLVSSRFENNYEFGLQFADKEEQDFNTQVNNTLIDSRLTIRHRWQSKPGHRFVFGADFNGLQVEYNFQEERQGEGLSLNEEQYNGNVPQLFASYELRIPKKFSMDLGIRSEAFASEKSGVPLLETTTLLPRFALRYYPFKGAFYLQSSGGIYRQYVYQLPAFYNDLGAGEHIWVLADDRFPVLNAVHLSAGFGYSKDRFLLEFEPYFKAVNNLSSWKVELEEGLENPFTQDGTLAALGIDVLIKKQWKRYSLWASYSLGAAINRYEQLNDGEYFPTDYHQLHRFNLTQTLALKRWDISATFNASSGRPYTTPSGLGSRIDKESGQQEYYLEYTEQNNGRLPTYHRLDLAVNYKFSGKRMLGKVGLSVFNFYNQRNLSDIDFFLLPPASSTGNPRPGRLERPMLGTTPNVFVQLRW